MKRICLMLWCAAATAWAAEGALTTTKDGTLRWQPPAGRAVRILPPELTGRKAILKKQSIQGNEAVLEYSVRNGTVRDLDLTGK